MDHPLQSYGQIYFNKWCRDGHVDVDINVDVGIDVDVGVDVEVDVSTDVDVDFEVAAKKEWNIKMPASGVEMGANYLSGASGTGICKYCNQQ